VSVLVLAFADDDIVDRCLGSITQALGQVKEPCELVLVLNRPSSVLRNHPRAKVVDPQRNLGFAGGVATALEAAGGEWIALVNDDCVIEPEALRELLAAGRQQSGVGSVAGLTQFADRPGIVNSAGLEIDALGVASERLVGEPVDGPLTSSRSSGRAARSPCTGGHARRRRRFRRVLLRLPRGR